MGEQCINPFHTFLLAPKLISMVDVKIGLLTKYGCNVMGYDSLWWVMTEVCNHGRRSHKDEVKAVLASEPGLVEEVEFDLRRFEKEEQERKKAKVK